MQAPTQNNDNVLALCKGKELSLLFADSKYFWINYDIPASMPKQRKTAKYFETSKDNHRDENTQVLSSKENKKTHIIKIAANMKEIQTTEGSVMRF